MLVLKNNCCCCCIRDMSHASDNEALTKEISEKESVYKEVRFSKENKTIANDDGDDDVGVPYEDLRPTYTHEVLCQLVQLGFIKHIISQNGDGLHSLSGIPDENLSELHGNVFVEKCEKCGMRYQRPFYVLDDDASLYYEELGDFGATTVKKPRHAKKCKLCGLCHRTGRKCTQQKVSNL